MKHVFLLGAIIGVCFTIQADAAKRFLASLRMKERLHLYDKDRTQQPSDPVSLLALDRHMSMVPLLSLQTAAGTTKVKYQQTFMGLEVFDHNLVLEIDQHGKFTENAYGYLIEDISEDIAIKKYLQQDKDVYDIGPLSNGIVLTKRAKNKIPPKPKDTLLPDHFRLSHLHKDIFSKEEALRIACRSYGTTLEYSKPVDSRLLIFLDAEEKAHLAYKLHFLVEKDDTVSVPVYVIDASNGEVLDNWLFTHTVVINNQPGGTVKSGKYIFGTGDLTNFEAKEVCNEQCVLENADVRALHCQFSSNVPTSAYNFTCANGVKDEINGGYSPLADAYFGAGKHFEMYRSWYNNTVVYSPTPITLAVHYGSNYQNAFYDGSKFVFGDGARSMYPLASCFDVVGHEINHGFTDKHSGLIYRNQSGGINEAFSDMGGETLEFYITGRNDWKVGWQIIKGSGALRYMDNPSRDGRSINNAADYYDGLDVHYSSGVFNRAFYLLSNTPNWGIRKAYEVMLHANMLYWSSSTNYQKGAEGVVSAARDRGYSTGDVEEAFDKVGVCASSNCVTDLETGESLSINGDKDSERIYKIDILCPNTSLRVSISGGSGDADIYLKYGSKPLPPSVFDLRSWNYGNVDSISIPNTSVGSYFVTIHGFQAYMSVTLTVTF